MSICVYFKSNSSLSSSALTVQAEYGEFVQARVADAFQHPGGRAGGPGPGHRCPKGTYQGSW